MTPAGTSNELDVQNGWEENTHNTILRIGTRTGLLHNYILILYLCESEREEEILYLCESEREEVHDDRANTLSYQLERARVGLYNYLYDIYWDLKEKSEPM